VPGEGRSPNGPADEEGQWIGLDKKERKKISGHSVRVGAAQDLLALNMDKFRKASSTDCDRMSQRMLERPVDPLRCASCLARKAGDLPSWHLVWIRPWLRTMFLHR
jgi:hypothetical protein